MSRIALLTLLVTFMLRAEDFPPFEKLTANPALPDPLVMFNGEKVTTKEQWVEKRRPELKALFEHYMYGKAPPPPEKVDCTVEREDKNYFGGKATKKELTLKFGPPNTPPLHVLLIVPNNRKNPAPVFVGPNFRGNHEVVNDPNVAMPTVWVPKGADAPENKATEAGRGKEVDVWNIENTISRGYAVALYYCGDVDPDKNDFTDGVHAAYLKEGEKRNAQSWGTVRAWAWGMSRIVDVLVTNPDIDKTKIIAVGHSRLGKTSIVAAAFDERIAMSIPLQAGCGGTGPSRVKNDENLTKIESVKRINTSFPHWFCDEFKNFNDKTEFLPFDQNCLVALVAPRPVLFANAVEDMWANPPGQFDVLKAADPVYRLLGAGGLDAKTMPENNKLVDSTLGYFIRPGKHSMTLVDWNAFLDFADKHFGKPQ